MASEKALRENYLQSILLGSAKQCDTYKTRQATLGYTCLERHGVEPGPCPSRAAPGTPSTGGSAQPAWSSLLSLPSLVTARGKEVTFQPLWMKSPNSPGSQYQCSKHSFGRWQDHVTTLREAQTVGFGVSTGLPVQRQGPVQCCLVTQLTCRFSLTLPGNRLES